MAVCQNHVPLVNIKIAGKWMFIPLKMVRMYRYWSIATYSNLIQTFVSHVEFHFQHLPPFGRSLRWSKRPAAHGRACFTVPRSKTQTVTHGGSLRCVWKWDSHDIPMFSLSNNRENGWKWMKMVSNYQIWAPLVTLRTQKHDWKGVMGIGTPSFDLYWASTCCKTFPYPSWHADLSMDASAAHTKV